LADIAAHSASAQKTKTRQPGVHPGFRPLGLAAPRTFNRCRWSEATRISARSNTPVVVVLKHFARLSFATTFGTRGVAGLDPATSTSFSAILTAGKRSRFYFRDFYRRARGTSHYLNGLGRGVIGRGSRRQVVGQAPASPTRLTQLTRRGGWVVESTALEIRRRRWPRLLSGDDLSEWVDHFQASVVAWWCPVLLRTEQLGSKMV